MWDTDNVFLNGPYAPWREEGVAFDLEVEGRIPPELNGALYRAGSNQHYRPLNPARYHAFDGDGMVHAFFLRDGKATYRNRYVQTEALKLEMKEGRALFGSMINGTGTPMDPNSTLPPIKGTANTNVSLFDDRILMYLEVDLPYELRPDTLETVGQYDFHGAVSGAVTAHFKMDPENGDMLFYSLMGTMITWYRADKHGVLLDTHKFDIGVPSFIHDYAVTPTYAIFTVSPQLFALEMAVQGMPAVVWDTETMPVARFAVLHRETGKVRWFDADQPFQATHYSNAYDDGQSIVVDAQRSQGKFGLTREELATYGTDGDYNSYFIGGIPTITTRWTIDLTTGAIKETPHTDVKGEFPRINDARSGLKHRFGYFTTVRETNKWIMDGVAKTDTVTGNTSVVNLAGLTAPSEPVFVAREGATAEDDGWLMSVWWDPATDKSELVILDAQDVSAAPVARVKLNHRVPLGYHGNWVPAADLEAALHNHQG